MGLIKKICSGYYRATSVTPVYDFKLKPSEQRAPAKSVPLPCAGSVILRCQHRARALASFAAQTRGVCAAGDASAERRDRRRGHVSPALFRFGAVYRDDISRPVAPTTNFSIKILRHSQTTPNRSSRRCRRVGSRYHWKRRTNNRKRGRRRRDKRLSHLHLPHLCHLCAVSRFGNLARCYKRMFYKREIIAHTIFYPKTVITKICFTGCREHVDLRRLRKRIANLFRMSCPLLEPKCHVSTGAN